MIVGGPTTFNAPLRWQQPNHATDTSTQPRTPPRGTPASLPAPSCPAATSPCKCSSATRNCELKTWSGSWIESTRQRQPETPAQFGKLEQVAQIHVNLLHTGSFDASRSYHEPSANDTLHTGEPVAVNTKRSPGPAPASLSCLCRLARPYPSPLSPTRPHPRRQGHVAPRYPQPPVLGRTAACATVQPKQTSDSSSVFADCCNIPWKV